MFLKLTLVFGVRRGFEGNECSDGVDVENGGVEEGGDDNKGIEGKRSIRKLVKVEVKVQMKVERKGRRCGEAKSR